MKKKTAGFTLVELIVVMVITGIVAGVVTLFVAPAFQNYAIAERRANLTHQADTALRRIVTEVRTAVPNSLRLQSPCLEMVPTSEGGRVRMLTDPTIAQSDALDLSVADTGFDVLTPMSVGAGPNTDWVVVGNLNTDDVYTGASRAQMAATALPVPAGTGTRYITLAGAGKQFPFGYDGGRFVIVPDSQQAVTYVCEGAGLNAEGTGTGTLARISHYGFLAGQQCPIANPAATRAVVATRVSACNFVYSPNQGVVQQSGFVQLQLTLADHGEAVTLTVGSQVENAP